MKYFVALAAVSVSFSLTAIAETERDLDSHVHGAANLNVAIADSAVFIELDTPWNNLVGFEHAPQTDGQHTLVDTALEHLNDPTQLFSFDGANCTLDTVMLDNTLAESDSHDEEHDAEHSDDHDAEHSDDHDKEHGDDHDEEHDDDHDKEHDHEHNSAESESGSHESVLVTYTYSCDQIGKLNSIDLSLFSVWPGFEELDVQLIGENGQTLVELTPQDSVLKLDNVK